uniref:Uncharacterized protein n=1 Tax=Palpitomonas bilix TaxID=652834 RepID=A0A7S3GDA4_9EUKA
MWTVVRELSFSTDCLVSHPIPLERELTLCKNGSRTNIPFLDAHPHPQATPLSFVVRPVPFLIFCFYFLVFAGCPISNTPTSLTSGPALAASPLSLERKVGIH